MSNLSITGSNQAYRALSIGQLNAFPHLHLRPIDVVVINGPQGRPGFWGGFPLRCLQRLTCPIIATLHCCWRNNSAFEEALANCQWVLEIDKKNVLSQRICGQALIKLNRLDEAEAHLKKAIRLAPKDRAVKRALDELQRQRTSTTS